MGQPRIPIFSLNRSGPRQKDGSMIVKSTEFAGTQIKCVHHWMPGRILGLWLKYVISAYAQEHDERTQPVTFESLRIEF